MYEQNNCGYESFHFHFVYRDTFHMLVSLPKLEISLLGKKKKHMNWQEYSQM